MMEILFKVLFALVITLDVFGNTLVILVVLLNRSMQTAINYLLANLALADLLVGLLFIPDKLVNGTYKHPGGWVGDLLCKTLTYINLVWFVAVASVMTLVVISWERYFAILYPRSSRGRFTKRRLRRLIACTWAVAVISDSVEMWSIRFDENEQICIYDWSDGLWKANMIWWNVVVGLLPLGIQASLYARVVYRLWGQQSLTTDMSQRSLLLQRKRLTKVVITITVLNVIFWFPINLYYFLDTFFSDTVAANMGASAPLLNSISHLLLLLNSTVNPMIYAAQDRRFRRHMRRVLTRGSRLHPQGGSTTLRSM